MSQEVTAYIEAIALPWQAEAARTLRAAIREAVPGAVERIQYKQPHYLVGKKYLAVISPSKNALGLTIFNAQATKPPEGFFLPNSPPERKTVKFKEGDPIDVALVTRLVGEAASALG